MSPEAQLICYLIAFIAFVAGAAITFGGNDRFAVCMGLAAWVLVPLWAALKAV